MWNEALDQAKVEASSALRKAKNVYYPLVIRSSGSLGFKADPVSLEADEGKESPPKAPPIANISSKEAGQSEDAEKEVDTTKEGAHDVALPPIALKDPSKEKEASHNMSCAGNSPHTLKGRTQRQRLSIHHGSFYPTSQELKG